MNSAGAAHAAALALIQPRHPPRPAVEVLREPEPPVAAQTPIPAVAAADVPVADTHCRNPADNTGIVVAVAADIAPDAAIVAVVGIGNRGNKLLPIDYTPVPIDCTPAPIDRKPVRYTPECGTNRTAAKSSLDSGIADTDVAVVDAVALAPLADVLGTVAAVAIL